MKTAVIALAFGVALAGPLAAQIMTAEDGDAERGADLAAESCAQCHDITQDGEFKTYPPSFASIGAYRSDDQIFSRIYFPQMHTAMPEMGWYLDRQGIADLVAYIRAVEITVD